MLNGVEHDGKKLRKISGIYIRPPFLPRDARSAERGIATLMLSVRLPVCDVEVRWSYRLGYFDNSTNN